MRGYLHKLLGHMTFLAHFNIVFGKREDSITELLRLLCSRCFKKINLALVCKMKWQDARFGEGLVIIQEWGDLFRGALFHQALKMIIISVIRYLKLGLVTRTNKLLIHMFLPLVPWNYWARKDLCDTFKGPRQTIERRKINFMEMASFCH